MPKIQTEFRAEKPFYEGLVGEIKTAEVLKTAVSGYDGVRVTVEEAGTGEKYAEMLWIRGFVGLKSKLGAFISELGDNTDSWVGKTIRIVRWKEKDRQIQIVDKTVKRGKTP